MSDFVPVISKLYPANINDLVRIDQDSNNIPWNCNLFSEEFTNSCARIFGIRCDGQLVGFVICHVVSDEAHIVSFGVYAAYRRRGLGRALLSYLLRELHIEAVRWVTLEVRRGNAAARGLYESLGFLEVGVRAGYYRDNGEDALLLKLNLADFASSWGAEEE